VKTMANIKQYKQPVEEVIQKYCQHVTPAAQDSEYIEILEKNTSRLQGSLVLLGYELCGGKDKKMIERAALAIELFHAYVKCLEQNIDITQALRAQHEAEIIMANLETDPEYRIKALGITNRTLMLANLAYLDAISKEDKLHWRATELTLNPIHVGQVLAGSDCDANNAVTPIALEWGEKIAEKQPADTQEYMRKLDKAMQRIHLT
jgi:hypothetical protein